MVSVRYCKETFDTYFAPVDRDCPGFSDTLIEDFRRYQASNGDELPDYFGCDNPYGWPPSIANCIEHIHLCIPPRTFDARLNQRDRKCKIGKPQDDVALVYSRGLIDDTEFLLIGVLMPDAHAQARCRGLMEYLGGIGREFARSN